MALTNGSFRHVVRSLRLRPDLDAEQAAYVYVTCPGPDATPEIDMLMASGILALTAAPPPE